MGWIWKGKKQSNSESKNALMCNNRRYKYHVLHGVYTQNSLKQNKIDYTIIRMSHNVTIRYRYKLFVHKLAWVGDLGSGSCQMS